MIIILIKMQVSGSGLKARLNSARGSTPGRDAPPLTATQPQAPASEEFIHELHQLHEKESG